MAEKTYNKRDLEAALSRAFVDGNADFIPFDGHDARSKFLRDSINLGLEKGWLKENPIEEEQWTTIIYRLTNTGKKYFGLNTT